MNLFNFNTICNLAAGVLAAIITNVDKVVVAELATSYCALRFLYTVVYISFNDVFAGWLRSTVWWAAGVCAARLLVLAAQQ